MILSSGVDIVDVYRIENIINNKRDKFYKKVFTLIEKKYIEENNHNPQTIAGMFAAKEAISKLLGTGIGKVNFHHIEILHDENKKPYINLYDEGLKVCSQLGIDNINLSISHEKKYAIAFAIGYGKDKRVQVPKEIKRLLPKRDKSSHKGTFGRVGIIAGSMGMTGAAYLSSMASLRTGSGLVYSIIPESLKEILSIKLTEAIIKPVEDDGTGHFTMNSFRQIIEIIEDMDIIAIGPGIGVDDQRLELIRKILLEYKKPVVLDADGINLVSLDPTILSYRQGPTIITPHPGELSRLLGVSINDIQKGREEYSKFTSNKYNTITVLKGANTVVTDGKEKIYINSTGNPGMATAGSGDVLTGMITSFVGQGMSPYEGAVLGVYCHGLAGDLVSRDKGEYGMIASDILNNIPYSIKNLEEFYNN
ncbi:NAD(P)H-hydrate epimerase [Keratinibaculum paraultunense]|uniref:Multifunctional fusion protein n=1 Tax=Keratinibaculum paraultunense TaxID=1278232 RepID=A0A4R3L0F0_9FIRM|nr:NAD(P)H-hydrate dehydratase [Keratinibaculum paraultunense]QQY80024.1 NAD(P)H-hydrate dehydratase [Keratinibaculum paraultunense]TCS91655.1 NAD(P)H-hydrate epimerase [Keratinibaculum paraultunense]